MAPCSVTVLHPLGPLDFFVFSIKKCRSDHASSHIPKYADDSVIVSLLHGSAHDHSPGLVNWCDHKDQRDTQ